MEILQGLSSHQVLQRNAQNVCQVLLSGQTAVAGRVQLHVTSGARCLPGFNDTTIARVRKGRFTIKLTGIPVGGPYAIRLKLVLSDGTVANELTFDDVLVGDVWILAGQSNMEGVGDLKDAEKTHQQVRAFYMDDRWAIAKDPIHQLNIALDPVHADINGGLPSTKSKHVGTGPGVSFGRAMYDYTKVPQGLIACAHGGTNMTQWDPSLKKKRGASLYGAMLRRFAKNGSNVAGLLWYQGCSDAIEGNSELYTKRMRKFVSSIRRDCGNAGLPVAIVQIAGVYCPSFERDVVKHWNSVQEQQRQLPRYIKKLAVVAAIDLAYNDEIHISGADQQRLGRRLAHAMVTLTEKRKYGKKVIELKSLEMVSNKITGTLEIHVQYAGVEGVLKAAGKPQGFCLVDQQAKIFDCIYRIDLAGSLVILRTNLVEIPLTLSLHYGFGLSPYCNIVDETDQSVPVFGPLKVSRRLSKVC